MKRVKALQAAFVACGLALAGSAMAGPSAEALAYTCFGCHGTNGMSNGPATPSLAGMAAPSLVETMENYKSGAANATIMNRIAKGYTTEQFKLMGDYFSKQTFKPASQASDAKLAGKGAKLHDKYCEKCHSDGGGAAAAKEDEVGILAGQWKPYLHNTLTDFMNGSREMPKKMKKKLAKMHKKEGDAGLKALVEYYGSAK